MEHPEILEKLLLILEEDFGVTEAEHGSTLELDLGLDPSDIVELRTIIEEVFSCEVEEDSDFSQCSTVEDLAAFLEETLVDD